jgi:hypothetical protein
VVGVGVHAAGIDGHVPLREVSHEQLTAVLSAKVDGARLLDQRTRHLPLERFICFSSLASVLGASGRAHYAAANAFLDALACERRACALPALTVSWGPWAGGGMATAETLAQFERVGNYALAPEDAFRALDAALARCEPQVTIANIDWTVFRPVYESARPRPVISEISSTSGRESASLGEDTQRSTSIAGDRHAEGPSPGKPSARTPGQ